MTRVLLFGGSGFIGSHVRSALEADPRLTVVSTGRHRFDLVHGDLAGLVALVAETAPDAVVNCTGRLGGTGYDLVLANTAVTAKLIEAVATAAPGARLVRLGSASEYGVVPYGLAVPESQPALPVSEYGASHLAGTHLVQVASAAGRVDGVVLRVFNPIGAGLHEDNMLGRAAALIRRALADGAEAITLGPLDAHRDFVDVRDVASAVHRAVLVAGPGERVYNVASGQAIVARSAVRLLAEAAGFTGQIHERGAGPARSSTVHWMCGDITRANAMLGWAPEHGLADAVKRVWTAAP